MTSREAHDRMANAIRALAMDAVERAQSGHAGPPMGAADIATVRFTGMSGFGASAPCRELYRHFGITAQAIADAALRRLGAS